MEAFIPSDEELIMPQISPKSAFKKDLKPKILNFNEEEESSCVVELEYLSSSIFKSYFILPLCSLLTLFLLPIKLYWSVQLRVTWMYSIEHTLERARFLFVKGKDGNTEVVKL